jgi:hypothetical protein
MKARRRTCSRCHQSKPVSAYYVNPTRSSGIHAYCKACFNAYTTDRFRRRKKQAVEYLGGRCADCKGVYPYFVYDFHHLDATEKELQFTSLRRRAWPAIQAELDKCILLCANCHRIRHWERFAADGTVDL